MTRWHKAPKRFLRSVPRANRPHFRGRVENWGGGAENPPNCTPSSWTALRAPTHLAVNPCPSPANIVERHGVLLIYYFILIFTLPICLFLCSHVVRWQMGTTANLTPFRRGYLGGVPLYTASTLVAYVVPQAIEWRGHLWAVSGPVTD